MSDKLDLDALESAVREHGRFAFGPRAWEALELIQDIREATRDLKWAEELLAEAIPFVRHLHDYARSPCEPGCVLADLLARYEAGPTREGT